MQTLLPHGNMMNLVVLCLCEVSWTKLIVVLKNSTGLGGNGLVRLHEEVLRVAPKETEGNFVKRVVEKIKRLQVSEDLTRASRPRRLHATEESVTHLKTVRRVWKHPTAVTPPPLHLMLKLHFGKQAGSKGS